MFTHHGVGEPGAPLQSPEDGFAGRRVPECHGQVPEPSPEPGAAERAPAGFLLELGFGPAHERGKLGGEKLGAWSELGQGFLPGKLVHGTDELAIVTSENAIADGAPELDRYGSPVFDGEIGNAAPGIEFIGPDDGPGRTDLDTGLATTAMVFDGRVYLKRQSGQDLAQEKIRPAAGCDQVRVFADPAESGVPCERFFEDGSGIDKDPEGVGHDRLGERLGQPV